jgi:hypothetical protein
MFCSTIDGFVCGLLGQWEVYGGPWSVLIAYDTFAVGRATLGFFVAFPVFISTIMPVGWAMILFLIFNIL